MDNTFFHPEQVAAIGAIGLVQHAAKQCADAHATVMILADQRPLFKAAAIRRLMQTTNEETGKPHSASSAEKVVELDAEFAAHRTREREAEVARWTALGNLEAAKLTARLCVALAGGAE